MPGFGDRLAAMKAAQAGAERVRQQEEAEASKMEKLSELSQRLESVREQLAQAQPEAAGAEAALSDAKAFEDGQGENLAPDAKAEIDALRAEVAPVMEKFKGLEAEVRGIQAEIAVLEGGGAEATAEQPAEEAVEAPAEVGEVEAGEQDEQSAEDKEDAEIKALFRKTEDLLDQAEEDLKTINSMREKIDDAKRETLLSELQHTRREILQNAAQYMEKISPYVEDTYKFREHFFRPMRDVLKRMSGKMNVLNRNYEDRREIDSDKTNLNAEELNAVLRMVDEIIKIYHKVDKTPENEIPAWQIQAKAQELTDPITSIDPEVKLAESQKLMEQLKKIGREPFVRASRSSGVDHYGAAMKNLEDSISSARERIRFKSRSL